jgi:hypothetical protein
MRMDVAVMVVVGVGVVVRHRKMLHYNITGVHAVARPQAGLLERAKVVIPREGGVSSTRGLPVQSLLSLEYWVTRLRG